MTTDSDGALEWTTALLSGKAAYFLDEHESVQKEVDESGPTYSQTCFVITKETWSDSDERGSDITLYVLTESVAYFDVGQVSEEDGGVVTGDLEYIALGADVFLASSSLDVLRDYIDDTLHIAEGSIQPVGSIALE
jgi:hypothetical protein